MKKNYFLLSILFAVTALIFYSCKGGYGSSYTPSGPGGTPTTGSATDSINITGYQYVPAIDTVHVGVPVKWKNNDPYPHTVTSDNGTTFSSGNIASGGIFTFTPATTGTFMYHDVDYPATVGKLIINP